MTFPRYARLASRLLAQSARPTPVPAPTPDARAAAIAAVAAAIRTRHRERRIRRSAASLAGVAALVAATFGADRYLARRAGSITAPVAVSTAAHAGVRIIARAQPRGASGSASIPGASPADGWELGAGSRVVAPVDGRVALSFSTGTTAVLHETTDLTVVGVSAVEVLRLDSGSADFHVAKLGAGERFLVDTSDAEIEVRGTQFNVSVVAPVPWCGAGALTRVSVTEGVVVVRHDGIERRVGAGQQWPADCTPPAGAPVVLADDLPRVHSTPSAPGSSTLGEQNALFSQAVAARRRGDSRGALAALEHLLVTYPASPLGESATVERLRLLVTSAPSRAPAAASEYLKRYPDGFARAEAEQALAGGP